MVSQIVDRDSGNLYPIYIYNKNCGFSFWTCSREISGEFLKRSTYSHEKLTKIEIRSSWSRFEHYWPLLRFTRLGHRKSNLVIIWPNSYEKLTNSSNQFKSVQTLLRITHLTHRKPYLVIIWPNSHEKLTKSEIRSNSSWFEHCSGITHLAHRKSYLVIICPNSHEKLTKSEIRSSSSRFEHCSESLI